MKTDKKRKLLSKVLSNFNHKLDPEELSKGIEEEDEHDGEVSDSTNITKGNKMMMAKIAVAHLKEDPKYYSKLEKTKKDK